MKRLDAHESPTRPALRYHGGKWRLAPWIIAHMPPHRVYVEPFGGGASVLLRKPRSYAEVYNDLDGEVVNFFRVLRNPEDAAALIESVRLTPFAREEFDASYATTCDPIERARRLCFRSHAGFGTAAMRSTVGGAAQRTGFRVNTTRSGTTPAGDWSRIPGALSVIVERMRGVVIESRPALDVIRSHDAPNTLFYVDPPYPHGTRTKASRNNYRHEMTNEDHCNLAGVLRGVAGAVILSGYHCDLYDVQLYADWHRVERAARADGAGPRCEVLWLNGKALAARDEGLFNETP